MSDADRISVSFKEESAFNVSPAALMAQGTLTLDTNPTDGDTMTVDSTVYRFKDTMAQANDIKIGASLAATQASLIKTMLGTGTAGTDYYAGTTTPHATVRVRTPGTSGYEAPADVAFNANNELVFEAKTPGTAGNSIATTETFFAGTNVFDAATLGTTQAGTDVAYQAVRLTSESFKQVTANVQSAEIRDDRQIAEVPRVNIHAEGELGIELSYGAYDEFMAMVLQSAGWSSPVADTQTTFSFDATDNSINDSGSGFVAAGFVANQWIRTSGAVSSNNNQKWKIVSVAAGKMVLTAGKNEMVTESAGASIQVYQGGQIVNGVADRYVEFDKKFTDLTDEYEYYTGMSPNTLSLSFVVQAIVTGSIGFLGKRAIENNSPRSSSITAAPTKNVLNNVDDIVAVIQDNLVYAATNFNFDYTNNMRQRSQLAELGPISLGSGSIGITGGLEAYHINRDVIKKYLDDTEVSLAMVTKTGEGDGYVIEFPRVKLTDGSRNATGQNTDIMVPLTFESFRHASEGITCRIARFPA